MASSAAPSTDREAAVLDAAPKRLFIGGSWRDAAGGATVAVRDPATGAVLCEVADGSPDDAVAALDAAVEAAASWAATPPRERGELLRRVFELLHERIEDLALLMTLEMGKPLGESRSEIAYAAEFFRWFSEEAVRIRGSWAVEPGGSGRLLVMQQPVGPCLLITPWNFPLAMGTRKIGPALAAGCTCVLKPATETPLSMLALAGLLEDAGLPPGVLNVVVGQPASELTAPVIADPRLRKVSFTGSTPVGSSLMGAASENLLRLSMELGGNAPLLIFDDADLDRAVEGLMLAKMRNLGESCVAANRIYVQAAVADEVTARVADRMRALKTGRGTDDGVDVGPLINAEQREKVAELVDDARSRGAKVVLGGAKPDGPGYFYPPTLLTDIPADARLLTEEIFGPVAPIIRFGDEEAGVRAANDTPYGLIAYVFTRDLERAFRVTEALQVGMVGVNRGLVSNPAGPFGGVKQSGFGREGGAEGIHEYLSTKYVALEVGS